MWTLSTGKKVEEAVFRYALTMPTESIYHSFVVDCQDTFLVTLGVFSKAELQEIALLDVKAKSAMPEDLKKYLLSFDLRSLKQLRDHLYTPQDWQKKYDSGAHADFEWIHGSFVNMLREQEFKTLDVPHLESWYNAHIWKFIDSAFDDVMEVDLVRGESTSQCSSLRKNLGRTSSQRKQFGRRLDFIIRCRHVDHAQDFEFGAGECGKAHQADTGTKALKEAHLKLPKVMKDMLDHLAATYPAKLRKFEVLGVTTFGNIERDTLLEIVYNTRDSLFFIGLSMSTLRMDAPQGFICRLTRSQQPTCIDVHETKFARSLISCLYMTWIVKAIVKGVVQLTTDDNDGDSSDDGSWLSDQVTFSPLSSPQLMPNCSTSPANKR
ncbi:hypothetical protein DM01DRAFT_1283864 [Hesseltinella vesiculosa]|uniref:Uncharacterized protein n=1 Tax=Hesseltinella vesiculosa TaxID=101127 RepID=A0A1X2GNK6_9FUNG|nr:hypothetical protein DM01DRAFT_1283864 [Hesseltinella vesiculosa]